MSKHLQLVVAIAFCTVALFGSAVQADQISYTKSIAPAVPNWSGTLLIPQYNGTGTLTSVDILLSGNVGGDMGFENRADTSATITMTLTGVLTLNGPPSFGLPLVVSPTIQKTASVQSSDTVLDFGGTSGKTYSPLSSAVASDTRTLTANLADYIGAGNVSFTIDGAATSAATGSGKMTSFFDSVAGADLTVTYHTMPVPEPSTLVGLTGLGLVGLAYTWRRRRSA